MGVWRWVVVVVVMVGGVWFTMHHGTDEEPCNIIGAETTLVK